MQTGREEELVAERGAPWRGARRGEGLVVERVKARRSTAHELRRGAGTTTTAVTSAGHHKVSSPPPPLASSPAGHLRPRPRRLQR